MQGTSPWNTLTMVDKTVLCQRTQKVTGRWQCGEHRRGVSSNDAGWTVLINSMGRIM